MADRRSVRIALLVLLAIGLSAGPLDGRGDPIRAPLDQEAPQDTSRAPVDSLVAGPESGTQFVWRRVDQRAFGVGERLEFDVSYGMITAGEAVLSIPGVETFDGRQAYKVEVLVNSLPSFSWIYKVEDRYRTFLDVEAIVPYRFEQSIREGNYARDFVAEFDHVRGVAVTTKGTYSIPPFVHDIMSAFYFVRTMDLSGMIVGETITLTNFYKDRVHELTVKYLGKQELEVGAGTFRAVVLEPIVKAGGLFKSEGRIVIWLTDDELRIPLRVNAKIPIGSIDVELRSYAGVRSRPASRIR